MVVEEKIDIDKLSFNELKKLSEKVIEAYEKMRTR